MLYLIAVFAFGAIALPTWELLRAKEDPIARRLGISAESAGEAVAIPRRRPISAAIQRGRQALPGLLPARFVRRIQHMLVMANEPWPLPVFLSTWAMIVAFGLLFVLYVSLVRDVTLGQVFSLSVAILPACILGPYAVLRRRVLNRQKAIIRALPDALDLLVTCVEAGMGIDAAFAVVVSKTDGPLAESFSFYLKQAGLGLSRRQALTDVSQRSGVKDLIGLATSVNRGEELGTTLGDVLRVQAEDLRAERRDRAHSAAQRAPVLMTIPLVVCFMPAMAAVVIVPSILNLINFTSTIGTG